MRLDAKTCSEDDRINYIPYCDGIQLTYCLMADEELGCAEVMDVDEKGKIIHGPDSCLGPQTHMVFGKIELRKKP